MGRVFAAISIVGLLVQSLYAMAAPAGTGFGDVPADHSFAEAIMWLAETGISSGCSGEAGGRVFCPDDPVSRGQMAAFLVRATRLSPGLESDLFEDDDTSVFEADIDALAQAGVAKGCDPPGNTRFCPDDPVTRGQMSAFLVRAFGLTQRGVWDFVDDDTSVFEGDIERLAAAGITVGCNPPGNTRFCPDDVVTRGQMAVFLWRAFHRPGPEVPPSTTPMLTSSTSGEAPTPTTGASSTTTTAPSATTTTAAPTTSTTAITSTTTTTTTTTPPPSGPVFERVSVSTEGGQSTGYINEIDISDDGRFVAMRTSAEGLIPDDINGMDVFVYDRMTNTMELVYRRSDGSQGVGIGGAPSLSGDGRYVAFASNSALVPEDGSVATNVYVFDRATETIERISVERAGEVDAVSEYPVLSGDGRFVVFTSLASNLVSGDANGERDIFLHDRQSGSTERISVGAGGAETDDGSYKAVISYDGSTVAFESDATNLVAGDTNGTRDVFVYDVASGTTELVSRRFDGASVEGVSFGPRLSADGTVVTFGSYGTHVTADDDDTSADVFWHDRSSDTTIRLSVGLGGTKPDGASYPLADLSHDGRTVVFQSAATNLVADDTNGWADLFRYDVDTGTIDIVTRPASGEQANGSSYQPRLSSDGRVVAFTSPASNLVDSDSNGAGDAFVLVYPTE